VIWENEPSRYWEASLNRQPDSSPLPNWTPGLSDPEQHSVTGIPRIPHQSEHRD
jgi:hypothetical protein